jgi:cell division septum initiation protein DivIVA
VPSRSQSRSSRGARAWWTKAEADLIVHEARLEQERLASDTEVYRLAQHQAQRVLDDAKLEADALRAETDEYVDGRLANFEITLERTLEAVRRGRERLAGQTVMDTLTAEEADKIVLPAHLED